MAFNAFLYVVVVVIWGSTWLAIKYQVNEVDALQAVLYRFALAAVLTQLVLVFAGRFKAYDYRTHGWFVLLGLFLFCINYYLFYIATDLGVTTGLLAVIFSLITAMNMLNARVFFGQRTDIFMVTGLIMGLVGITLVFHQDLLKVFHGQGSATGLWLGVGATYLASLGNMVSRRLQQQRVDVLSANGWGMTYGACILFIMALFSAQPFAFSTSASFLFNWVYLAVFGSIVAFWSYLTLLGRVGSDRAAYSALVFPVVALWLSWLFEDFQWTLETVLGVALILLGNLVITGRVRFKAWPWWRVKQV